jgi:hypothetical protein
LFFRYFQIRRLPTAANKMSADKKASGHVKKIGLKSKNRIILLSGLGLE